MEHTQVIKVGCGTDVHRDLIVATTRSGNAELGTREFGAYTSSLTGLRDRCKSKGVAHVAMEGTGFYRKPVPNVLEEAFEVILVNARHVKDVPGHRTDRKDSAWPGRLLLSGSLKASSIVPRDIRELRDLVRYRRKVVGQLVSEKDRIIRINEKYNI